MNNAISVNHAISVNDAVHVNDATDAKEGRTFFVVINILIGMTMLMTVAAVGVLVLAAISQ